MNKSSIEYLTHSWNFYTGCKNHENGICNLPCWARAMAHRFGRSFEPEFKRTVLFHKMPQNACIGVCFTGDLFGDWVNPDMLISPYATLKDGLLLKVEFERDNHNQFFFLTKCPWNLKKWGEFPDNAWVGATVTDHISYIQAMNYLPFIKAGGRWLSIEPLLGRIPFADGVQLPGCIQWVVIGAQTHPNILPKIEWVKEIVEAADRVGIPVFLKDNLQSVFWVNGCKDHVYLPAWATARGVYRQELPV